MFAVDKYSRVPIYEQIIAQVEMHIALGDLAPESLLPSVRSLSVELSVNPNTLQTACATACRAAGASSPPTRRRSCAPDARRCLPTSQKRRASSPRPRSPCPTYSTR